MATKTEKIDKAIDSALRIWKKVEPIKDGAAKVADPFAKYLQGPSGGPLRAADENLLTCLKLAVLLRGYTGRFKAGTGKPLGANYYLEEYTAAGVGRKADNAKAVEKLVELEKFLNSVIDMAQIGAAVTEALSALTKAPTSAKGIVDKLDAAVLYGNQQAYTQAMNGYRNAINDAIASLPAVRSATSSVKAMK